MAITNFQLYGKTFWYCSEEQEWKDLTKKGQPTFHVDESEMIQAHSELGKEFLETLSRMKVVNPRIRVLRIT